MSTPRGSAFVFNIVWTGATFPFLAYFVASQLDRCDARFRFVANHCPPDQVAIMERFASRHLERIVDVIDVSPDQMVPHGVALDRVRELRDDGDYFCMIDSDIKARGPFLDDFTTRLDNGCAGVTSGRGIWCESDVLPAGHPGVSGEYFYSQDGFLFGSPHFAMYRRGPLDETMARWHVGFHAPGSPQVADETIERLRATGHDYWIYDTGKIVNILLQEDGYRLCHVEHPNLLHIGGVSHYLAPVRYVGGDPEAEPDGSRSGGTSDRFEVSRFTASVLSELCDGRPAPEIPDGIAPSLVERLDFVREELIDLVATYASVVGDR